MRKNKKPHVPEYRTKGSHKQFPLMVKLIDDLKYEGKDNTARTVALDIDKFAYWLVETNRELLKLIRDDIDEYMYWLQENYRKPDGEKLPTNTASTSFSSVKRLFKYLRQSRKLQINPVEGKSIPYHKDRNIKKESMTEQERVAFLQTAAAYVKSCKRGSHKWCLGLRDLAAFAIAHVTGCRVHNICELRKSDLLFDSETIRFEKVKGNLGGNSPIIDWAIEVVEDYFKDVRPLLCKDKDPIWVFVNNDCTGHVTYDALENAIHQMRERVIKENSDLAKSLERKNITWHSLRSTFLTKFVEDGGSLAVASRIVHHQSLDTTARYINLSRSYMKKITKQHHPRK